MASIKSLSLYKLAKYTNLEIVMEAQVQSSGANQAKLMEKFKKNKSSIKSQAFAMKAVYGIMLLFLIVIPLFTILQLTDYFNDLFVSTGPVLLTGSILFSTFFGIQLIYLLLLGMFSIGAMMTGEAFRFFETLPISKKQRRKLGFFTVLRNLDVGLVIMMVGLPIMIIIVTQNIILSIISIIVSLGATILSFSVLVLFASKISQVFKVQEAGSKKSTIIRIITMLSYLLMAFSLSFFLQWAVNAAVELYILVSSFENIDFLNYLISLIPFPFAPSYLITMLIDPARFTMLQWLFTIIGNLLFGGLTYLVYKKAISSMRLVTSSAAMDSKQIFKKRTSKMDTKTEIIVRNPIIAYIRKDLSTATRDFQTLMFMIMPLILPFVYVISLLVSTDGGLIIGGLDVLWMILIFFQPIISMMITTGFLNVEDSGTSILASLPLHPRDQAKAKLSLLLIIQSLSFFLPLIIYIGSSNFIQYLLTFLAWYPIDLIFLLNVFYFKIRLFGRMKYKFVVEEIRIEKKILKWILVGILEFTICIGFIFIGFTLQLNFGVPLMSLMLLLIGVPILGLYIFSLHKIFPKKLGKRKFISIRENLRKKPIFGTLIILLLYIGFLFLPDFINILFIPLFSILSDVGILFINFIVVFGCMMLLWFLIVPRSLHLPNGDQKFKEYLNHIKLTRVKPLLKNLVIGIGCSVLFFISTYLMANFLGTYIFDLNVIFGEPSLYPLELGWFLFVLMLIPGIWEEVAFRGVLFQLNMRKYSLKTTLILTSLLFGAAHFLNLMRGQSLITTILQVIFATFLGFLFGYMYLKTNSLLPSIITHYLIDSVGPLFMNANFPDFISSSLFLIFGVGLIPTVFGLLFVKLIVPNRKMKN
ncbi:MAG: CPBP family intramembrane metalloprotease [Candidatus Lokiarchaeota archaeon]|nr:CPBP family intramembrane metalloprotease [Candidatus Lokiarchaeota archaeon]